MPCLFVCLFAITCSGDNAVVFLVVDFTRDWKNNRGGGGRHSGGGKRGRHSDSYERANKAQKV